MLISPRWYVIIKSYRQFNRSAKDKGVFLPFSYKNIDAFIENGGHGILVPARFNNLRGQDHLKVIKNGLAKFM